MLTSLFVGFGLLLFFGASDPFRCVRACVCVYVCVVCVCLVACWNRGRLRLRVPTYLFVCNWFDWVLVFLVLSLGGWCPESFVSVGTKGYLY